MNTFILILISRFTIYQPNSLSIIEFKSKEGCELALSEAKKVWSTVNAESYCIDVQKELEKKKLQDELKKLQ
jgi:hypothetical protein